jgi:hypothetical protein
MFPAPCRERLQRVSPPDNLLPLRVLSPDESRVGRLTVRRRRLAAQGVQPLGPVPHVVAWCYAYGAGAPTTGERCLLEWPSLRSDMFQPCLDALARAFPASVHILPRDHSGAHPAHGLRWPENGRAVGLPPYGPELNPLARVWRDVKDDVAWRQFAD